jgi:hypothetical protein
VQVKLEFGHKARMKSKILPDGFTHEWTVFVRGPDGCNIQHFVEKVVFYLHESFPKPRRGNSVTCCFWSIQTSMSYIELVHFCYCNSSVCTFHGCVEERHRVILFQ